MADMTFTNYMRFNKPPKGYPDWDAYLNANFDLADGEFNAIASSLSDIAKDVLGKAPGGFGLGGNAKRITDADSITETGFYSIAAAANTFFGGNAGQIIHIDYGAAGAIQLFIAYSTDRMAYRRRQPEVSGDEWLPYSNVFVGRRSSIPDVDAAYDLGALLGRFRHLYLSGNIVYATGNLNYEEGEFTSRLYGATTAGTNTYSAQIGHYVKIGRLAFIHIRLDLSNKDTTAAGDARVDGLPFRVRSLSGYYPKIQFVTTRVTIATNHSLFAQGTPNTFYISLYRFASATAASTITMTDIADNSTIILEGCYQIA